MNNKLKSMIAGTLVATAAANTLSLESPHKCSSE